jgi:hypothetical protein
MITVAAWARIEADGSHVLLRITGTESNRLAGGERAGEIRSAVCRNKAKA